MFQVTIETLLELEISFYYLNKKQIIKDMIRMHIKMHF